MDLRKLYGVVSALGKRLGDAEREGGDVLPKLRAAESREALVAAIREAETGLPEKMLDGFFDALTEENWSQWKARIVLQTKMVATGEKPAPGHEAGSSPMGG